MVRGQIGGDQAKIADAGEQLAHLLDRFLIGLGNRPHHQFFAQPDLDRLEEWHQAPLDEIAQWLNFLRRALGVEPGEDLDELVPLARRFQPVEFAGQFGKRHGTTSKRSRSVACDALILRRAVCWSNQPARSTSGNVCISPDRGGHSSSNVLLLMFFTSRSPSTAHASTIFPPACRIDPIERTGPIGAGTPSSSWNSRRAATSGSSPSANSPFGIDQAPSSRLTQKGPPGCTSSTSSWSARCR